jgi:hypothetical protein
VKSKRTAHPQSGLRLNHIALFDLKAELNPQGGFIMSGSGIAAPVKK